MLALVLCAWTVSRGGEARQAAPVLAPSGSAYAVASPLPPPITAVTPAVEYAPVAAVLVTDWSEELSPSHAPLIAAIVDRGVPVVGCSRDDARLAVSVAALAALGVGADAVDWRECELNTVWMRDYGPLFGVSETGELVIGDAIYVGARPLDDAFPSLVAGWDGGLAYRVPVPLDGGNVLVTDDGRCLSTSAAVEASGLDEAGLEVVLEAWLGCSELIALQPLPGESTGHVDVFVTHGPGGLGVGSYHPDDEPELAAVLDANAEVLRGHGYAVVRVPMPGTSDSNGDGFLEWRTHLNLVPVDHDGQQFVLAPVYRDDASVRSEALEALAQVFPGWEIVEVEALDLVRLGGALHCVTKTVPELSPVEPGDTGAARACACGASGSGSGGLAVLALTAAAATRRRRGHQQDGASVSRPMAPTSHT